MLVLDAQEGLAALGLLLLLGRRVGGVLGRNGGAGLGVLAGARHEGRVGEYQVADGALQLGVGPQLVGEALEELAVEVDVDVAAQLDEDEPVAQVASGKSSAFKYGFSLVRWFGIVVSGRFSSYGFALVSGI